MTQTQENLLAAYFSNQATDQEKEQLLSLLETDPEFAACFREMENIYAAACMPAFENTKEQDYQRLERHLRPRRIAVSFWKPFAIAASLAALVCFGIALYNGNRFQSAEKFLSQSKVTTINASRGTGTETVLPDGTHVHLNAGSSLSFGRNFGRIRRDVKLEGEGYFEVTSNAAKPFRVMADNACVTVKGTVFNVRSYADEPEIAVTLLEGSVQLNSSAEEVLLKPGTCAVVSRGDGTIRLENANRNVSLWTKGKISFTDKSIPEILYYLQRNYGVSFIYEDGLFGQERFTGIISANLSVNEVLSYIDVDHKFIWTRTDDTIEIHKK